MHLFSRYLYIHMYKVCRKIRRKGAADTALLYLSVVNLFLALPLALYIVALFARRLSEIVYLPLLLLYCFGIYLMTKKGLTKKKFREALALFNQETRTQKVVGNIFVVVLLLLSPILFMTILWLLAHVKLSVF